MALMSILEYRTKCFTDESRPTKDTVIRWINNGDIYAKKIGGKFYIDPDKEIIQPINPLLTKTILTLKNQ